MSNQSDQATGRPRSDQPPPEPARDAPVPGMWFMVLGGVLALLGPLAGFLVGSIVGSAREVGGIEARFASMFVGLLLGGVGVVVIAMGILRWHHSRHP